MAITLGYWDLRGKGEPVRLVLEYLGIDYKVKKYHWGDAPDFDTSDWTSVKFKLGIDFPNIPYIVDGDVKISESFAIMRYLARKAGKLYPETDEEHYKCDRAQGVVYDFRNAFVKTFYDRKTFEKSRQEFLDKFPQRISSFEDVLGRSTWLASDRLLYVDFWFGEYLNCLELCFPGILDKYPRCKQYLNKFDNLEPIAAYRKSDRFKKFPILGKPAMFGGQPE